MKRLSWKIVVVVAIFLALASPSLFRVYRIVAPSMLPSIGVGSYVLVCYPCYRLTSPSDNDLVLFSVPNEDYLGVKRVVGLPGQQIQMRRDRLIVDGEAAAYEPMGNLTAEFLGTATKTAKIERESWRGQYRSIALLTPNGEHSSFGQVVVPPGALFLLGDNRDNSDDSRIFGPLSESSIIGKVLLVFR